MHVRIQRGVSQRVVAMDAPGSTTTADCEKHLRVCERGHRNCVKCFFAAGVSGLKRFRERFQVAVVQLVLSTSLKYCSCPEGTWEDSGRSHNIWARLMRHVLGEANVSMITRCLGPGYLG